MGVNDATTFVQEGTENKERTITNNRVKVKVKVRDNVLMNAVAGQMEGDVRYVPIFFEAPISRKLPLRLKDDQDHLDASLPSMTRGFPIPTTQSKSLQTSSIS